MDWFESLFGAKEGANYRHPAAYETTQSQFRVDGSHLESLANERKFPIGRFSCPTLGELRTSGIKALSVGAACTAASLSSSSSSSSSTLYSTIPTSTCSSSSWARGEPLVISGVVVQHIGIDSALGLHALYPNAVFQAASQFNTLEFISASVTPEYGITAYRDDRTQGPDCALACAAGTLYRNYFVSMAVAEKVPAENSSVSASASSSSSSSSSASSSSSSASAAAANSSSAIAASKPKLILGQRRDNQINNLDAFETAVGNVGGRYFQVRNGYVDADGGAAALAELDSLILASGRREELLACIKIGLHSRVGVTFSNRFTQIPEGADILVTQCYCSALSIGYSSIASQAWKHFARLVLDAIYEATLWAAVINHQETGCPDVFLTFVGGGVFQNDEAWIFAAIARAIRVVGEAGARLRVHICHFRGVSIDVKEKIDAALKKP